MIDLPLLSEIISLTFYQSDDESRFIVGNVVRHHKAVTKKASVEVSPLLTASMEYLTSCLDTDVDSTSDPEIAALFLNLSSLKGEDAARMREALDRVAKSRATVSPRKVQNLKQGIKDKIRVLKTEAEMRGLFKRCSDFMDSGEDAETKASMLIKIKTKMEEMVGSFSMDMEMAETLNEVDFSDIESIRKALDQFDTRKQGGGFVWGWKALNDWFEHCGGGWRPGQALMLAGAADCGKSYLIRLIVQWAAMHNKPLNKSTRKRKAIVYNCLESEVDKIVNDFFIGGWVTENFGEPIPLNWNNLQKSEYINKFFGKRGYVLLLYRYGSSELTLVDYFAQHERIMKKYIIEFSFLDYVGIMSLEGMDEGNDAKNRQVIQARIRTFHGRHGIRYCTAAQLKESIKQSFRECRGVGVSIANSSWLADCTALEKETDLMFYVNVEVNHLGESYMTLKISRHRGESLPPINKRVFCMKFEPYGIPDDLLLEKSRAVANLMDVDDFNVNAIDAPAVADLPNF